MQKSSTYRPELDSIRALCIIFTVAGHVPGAMPLINGSVGVDVFFALSGWLVTSLLLKERQVAGEISLGSYYLRRTFRIVPLYALTIGLYFCAAYLLQAMLSQGEELSAFQSGFVYFVTFNGEYMLHRDGLLFGHSWTLGIEEKFYLFWPLAIILLGQHNISVLLGATILAITILILPASNPELLVRGYVGLAAGAFAAIASSRSTAISRGFGNLIAPRLALLGIGFAYLASVFLPTAIIWNLLISLFAVPLIAHLWIQQSEGSIGKVLRWTPLAALGRLTYAVYLTHVLVINAVLLVLDRLGWSPGWWLTFLLSYAASLLLGVCLHLFIERPFIAAGRNLSRRSIKGTAVPV
ncbi:MAG TPA: acyltransferase [Devosia sp.]|jgi:peptidoglycan/LPS O-acetylase OafA/YrhL|uniref:acyltransferase family protein n=1 Tax=Devosia sp. TaxID=1871048 RepID=UPI002F942BD1